MHLHHQYFSFSQAEAAVSGVRIHPEDRLHTAEYLFCGGCAGFAGSFIEGPIDLVSINLFLLFPFPVLPVFFVFPS